MPDMRGTHGGRPAGGNGPPSFFIELAQQLAADRLPLGPASAPHLAQRTAQLTSHLQSAQRAAGWCERCAPCAGPRRAGGRQAGRRLERLDRLTKRNRALEAALRRGTSKQSMDSSIKWTSNMESSPEPRPVLGGWTRWDTLGLCESEARLSAGRSQGWCRSGAGSGGSLQPRPVGGQGGLNMQEVHARLDTLLRDCSELDSRLRAARVQGGLGELCRAVAQERNESVEYDTTYDTASEPDEEDWMAVWQSWDSEYEYAQARDKLQHAGDWRRELSLSSLGLSNNTIR